MIQNWSLHGEDTRLEILGFVGHWGALRDTKEEECFLWLPIFQSYYLLWRDTKCNFQIQNWSLYGEDTRLEILGFWGTLRDTKEEEWFIWLQILQTFYLLWRGTKCNIQIQNWSLHREDTRLEILGFWGPLRDTEGHKRRRMIPMASNSSEILPFLERNQKQFTDSKLVTVWRRCKAWNIRVLRYTEGHKRRRMIHMVSNSSDILPFVERNKMQYSDSKLVTAWRRYKAWNIGILRETEGHIRRRMIHMASNSSEILPFLERYQKQFTDSKLVTVWRRYKAWNIGAFRDTDWHKRRAMISMAPISSEILPFVERYKMQFTELKLVVVWRRYKA